MRIQFWYILSQNHKPSNDYSDAVTRTLQGHFTSQDKYTAYQQNSVTVRLRSEGRLELSLESEDCRNGSHPIVRMKNPDFLGTF